MFPSLLFSSLSLLCLLISPELIQFREIVLKKERLEKKKKKDIGKNGTVKISLKSFFVVKQTF